MENVEISVSSIAPKSLFPQDFSIVPAKDRKRYIVFLRTLQKTTVEEDVKAAYRDFFSLPQDSSMNRDLYTQPMLFEFKYYRNLNKIKTKAEVLAQVLYYVHRLKYNSNNGIVSPFLCLAEVNNAIVTETCKWQSFYDSNEYDWTAAPSSPDTKLIGDLETSLIKNDLRVSHLFELHELMALDELFQRVFRNDFDRTLIIKRNITEQNFEDVYAYWYKKFGKDLQKEYRPSQYFLCDIQEGKTYIRHDINRVCFDIEDGFSKNVKLSIKEYLAFWELYNKNKNSDLEVIRGILSKADRLTEDTKRRMEGEFYTPIPLAKKAVEYLDIVIGDDLHQINWESGQYRLWDMACGTGNLEYHLPSKAYQYCYMSTLHSEDVIFCKNIFHGANVFQYDYLNDDIDVVIGNNLMLGRKMPDQLVNDLNNPKIKWIIFINPPFGTAQNKRDAKNSKQGISMTRIQHYMTINKLGEVSRELFSQFLYRIHYEFANKKVWLGLFSTLKYLNAKNDQKLREEIFRYKFEKGFIFESNAFDGLKPGFPIGFLVWNLSEWVRDFYNQNIVVEKCKKNGDAYDTKQLNPIDRKLLINQWISKRPPTTKVFPPFSSALNINGDKTDIRDRISDGFICSLCSKGNDYQNNNNVALFSGPYGSAGAFSVTADNFLKSMVIHAVRKAAKGDWSNDRDQFCIPYKKQIKEEKENSDNQLLLFNIASEQEFPMEFAMDCVVWSLFAQSNNTVALKDVKYKDKVYQIHNNLFPFTIEQVKAWGIQDPDINLTILAEKDNRFAANWLQKNQDKLSDLAKEIVSAAKEVYKTYFTNLNFIRTTRFQIKTWDAGRYQIIHSMEDAEIGKAEIGSLDSTLKKMAEKINSQLYTLGFLR